MRNMHQPISLISLILAAVLFCNAGPLTSWPTAQQAAGQDPEVKRALHSYLQQGYSLEEEYEYGYRYIVPPAGDYLWGECVYVFRLEPTDPAQTAAYVTLTAYVDFIAAEKGFRCSGLEVLEETFY